MTALPGTPPFALRARLLSPLADGGLLHELDGLLEVSNPGLWMAHCHIAEHAESGMMFSFRVARDTSVGHDPGTS